MTPVLIVLLSMLILFLVIFASRFNSRNHKHHKIEKKNNKRNHPINHDDHKTLDICRGRLSDREYLEHMIPHHQVAVDISLMLQDKTKSPIMQEILRKLIWTQNYEIKLMKTMITRIPEGDMSSSSNPMNRDYIETVADTTPPNVLGLTKTYCDPHFFDPKKHMEHMKHMRLDDEMYIKHMIPHHQVAVDMSKVLLQNTKNDFMIYLAYRIIQSQQAEIILLNDLIHNEYNYMSNLI